jgi:purine-binding chemotaxis protein CheW
MSTEPSAVEERLQRTMQDYLQVVTFRLDQEEYAIEITSVKEIILVEGVTRVPQMPSWVEGIINLRGNVIPVLDLRKRFGLPIVELGEHGRIVVARQESRIIGLIVDAVSQVMKLPRSDIQDPPDTIAGLAGDYLVGIAKVDKRLLMVLDIERILSTDEQTDLAKPLGDLPEQQGA